jgi:hypothetical protein
LRKELLPRQSRLLSQWVRPATVHSNKYTTTMADIIRTVTTIVIMCIAFTGMAVGIIIDQHRGRWWDSATSSVPT